MRMLGRLFNQDKRQPSKPYFAKIKTQELTYGISMKEGKMAFAVVAHREVDKEIEELLGEKLAMAAYNIDYSFSK